MNVLGNRIRFVRLEERLTMRAFSKIMRIGLQTLVRYEKAGIKGPESRYPPADFLERIISLYPKYNAGWLLMGPDEEGYSAPMDNWEITAELQNLQSQINSFSEGPRTITDGAVSRFEVN